jgi:hypothetical protein
MAGYPVKQTPGHVGANGIGNVAPEVTGSTTNMLIDGYPVHLRHPVKEKFDSYELFIVRRMCFRI